MDEFGFQATPVTNPTIGKLAELLRKGKEFGNQYQINKNIPVIGGTQLGDLFLQQTPEEVERYAYGDYPFRNPQDVLGTGGNRLDVFKSNRFDPTFDVASTLIPTGIAAAKAAPAMAKALAPKAAEMTENYLTKIGAINNIVPLSKKELLDPVINVNSREIPVSMDAESIDRAKKLGYIKTEPITTRKDLITDIVNSQNWTKEYIQNSADDIATQLNKLGFETKVEHSGSKAGPSSYVSVYDPETGRHIKDPFRLSNHSKGAFNNQFVNNVFDVEKQTPQIIQQALDMRKLGLSNFTLLSNLKQQYVNQLISDGMKPKTAYSQVNKISIEDIKNKLK